MGKRMYYILMIVLNNQNEYISANKIKEILNDKYGICLNVKTIYAILNEINDFFFPIIHNQFIDKATRVGYYINSEIFSDGQLQLLLDSITYHQDLRYEDKEELKNKLLKLSSFHQQSRLIQSTYNKKELPFSLFLNLNTIMKAIDEKSTISFEYINYQYHQHHFKEISINNDYLLSPYRILLNNNHYYLIGYIQKRKDELSIYRIDRMRYIQITKKKFIDIQEQFDMEEKINNMMNMFVNTETIDLVIEFHQSIIREVISRFSIDIEVEPIKTNWYQATIKNAEMSEGLIGWLMMLTDKIKVIAPIKLKDEMIKRIGRMEELYQL
jgi:predicted DNA-binding transcriptional regulator YafY